MVACAGMPTRRRLDEVQQEMDGMQRSEIFQLKQNIQAAEAKGDDPLGELAQQLMQEISNRKMRVEALL